MSKSAFYFSHDSNASQDPKILQMCSVYKAEGYGWYWMLIEQMRDQADYKLNISGKYAIDAFAMRMYCDSITMHKFLDDCVNEFQLFKRDKSCIWSESLLSRMGKMSDKSESAKYAADVRWGKQPRNNADAMQTHSERNANASKTDAIKESKVKEIKRNKTKVLDTATLKDIFYSFKNNNGYKDVNFDNEFNKFCEYWIEPPKKPKLACHNWLDKCLEFKAKQDGQNGQYKKNNGRNLPATYTDPDEYIRQQREAAAAIKSNVVHPAKD